MKQSISFASAVLLALATPVAAQMLGDLTAAMGAHQAATAAGASTAHQARDSITRHLPKPGEKLDDGEGSGAKGPMRTARASGGGSRGSWSAGGSRNGGGGWSSGGRGGGGHSGSWASPGNGPRKGR